MRWKLKLSRFSLKEETSWEKLCFQTFKSHTSSLKTLDSISRTFLKMYFLKKYLIIFILGNK